MDHAQRLYLDLMKKALTNSIYADSEVRPVRSKSRIKRAIAQAVEASGFRIMRPVPYEPAKRLVGRGDYPPTAHTMAGFKRLQNTQDCIERVVAEEIPGDLIETGVWRGGMTIFMRAVLAALDVSDRTVWVADSFAGLPPPDTSLHPADEGDEHYLREGLAVSLEQVQENFRRYDLLDDQVRFLEGFFADTLPTAPVERLAVLRLDGDMYGSTIEALEHLYPKLSVGGFVIVDDYGAIEACRQAVTDFRARFGISDEIQQIDWTGVFWRRSA